LRNTESGEGGNYFLFKRKGKDKERIKAGGGLCGGRVRKFQHGRSKRVWKEINFPKKEGVPEEASLPWSAKAEIRINKMVKKTAGGGP